MDTLVLPIPGEDAFLLLTAPDAARGCAGCGAAHAILIARYFRRPGSLLPVLCLVQCIACDAAEARVPA
jgi:hypothetical protein